MNLIYYAFCVETKPRSADIVDRFGFQIDKIVSSIESLRRHNSTIPVYVFHYGQLTEMDEKRLKSLSISLKPMESHYEWFSRNVPVGGHALADCPSLTRWIALDSLKDIDANQVLYIDTDTMFFDDPELIFREYIECDFYAREEPKSQKSTLEYEPSYLNENLLTQTAKSQGGEQIEPFNNGVILMNHRLHQKIFSVRPQIWSNILSATLWKHQNNNDDPQLSENERQFIQQFVDGKYSHLPDEYLPYPSSNWWIRDQVAVWLAFGKIKNIKQGYFSSTHVRQGHECLTTKIIDGKTIITHYFGANTKTFLGLVDKLQSILSKYGSKEYRV